MDTRIAAGLGKAGELAARVGYAARGVVYLSVGGLAMMAALGLTPRAEGTVGALEAWGRWPMGVALLWVTGWGLYAFAGWRALQSVFDVDHLGLGAKALGERLGKAVSGVLHGLLAASVFGLLDAAEDLREIDDMAATRESVEAALAMPMGGWLVIGLGLVIVGAGLGNMVRAMFSDFCKAMDCAPEVEALALAVARMGYFARGVALTPAGVFMVVAGWRARASDAKGVGGALEMFKDQPMGPLVLAIIALGLMAFGVFGLMKARFRRIDRRAIAAVAG